MDAKPSLDAPELLPFVPMVYVAWANGDLSPEEIGSIRSRIAGEPLLRSLKSALQAWLDPEAPPSASEVHRLRERLRQAEIDFGQKRRLSELGQALAGGCGEAELRALQEVETALGLADSNAGQRIAASFAPRPSVPSVEDPSFEPTEMTRFLDGPHHSLQQEVRAVLGQPRFQHRYDLSRQERRAWVRSALQDLAARGWGALGMPKEAGGEGGVERFITVFETLAHHDLSLLVKFGVQFGLFGGSVQNLGTERHHETLRAIGRGELLGCFAMTEIGHGSNVRELETTATWRDGGFVIHSPSDGAGKNWVGNAAEDGRMAVVFAQLDIAGEGYGVHAFLVPIRDAQGAPMPGVRLEDNGPKMGLEGVDNGRIWFDQIEVPRTALLDRFAQVDEEGRYHSPIPGETKRFFTMIGTLVAGRISVGVAGVSVAKSALTIAVRYGLARRQFGPPGEPEVRIMDYLAHQRRLLPRIAKTYALHFAQRSLLERYAEARGQDRDLQAIEAEAAGLKAYSTWHGKDTLATTRECCGGEGFAQINRIGPAYADFEIFPTFEGDNAVLLQLLTRALLAGYKRQFENMDAFGMMRFAADWASRQVESINPFANRETKPDTLRSIAFVDEALRHRAQHLLASLAQRLKSRFDRGLDAHTAINEVQDHVLSVGLAYVEAGVHERFRARVEAAPDALRPVLDRLRALYGLERLYEDRGWFLENGLMSGAQAKAIRDQVNALCVELRPEVAGLVDGFGIPDAVLAAPIATHPAHRSFLPETDLPESTGSA